MNEPQKQHCLKYLSIMQGMLSETRSKRCILFNKLRTHPDLLKEVQKETGMLESNVDAIKLALEFISQFPETVEEPTELVTE